MKTTKRTLLRVALRLLAAALPLAPSFASAAPARPLNVLVIMPDDLSFDDYSHYNHQPARRWCKLGFFDAAGKELCGAYYDYVSLAKLVTNP